jgi:hypothetical protein
MRLFNKGGDVIETVFSSSAGSVGVPLRVLCDRRDGGHLVVNPPRAVWERSVLTPVELMSWCLLVAATGRAMLDVLPQLRSGCLNYWEAGNWSLNPAAEPAGAKQPQTHRRVHLHVFGRSPEAEDADWRWGEAPRFPRFADVPKWAARFNALNAAECAALGARINTLMATEFAVPASPAAPT